MDAPRGVWAATLPAIVAGLFAIVCGNFQAPLSAPAVIVGHLVLLVLALAGGACWRDPLALGRGWRWLPWILWFVAATSWWRSPVHRAGTLGLLLAPAMLLGTAALARLWRDEQARRWGLRAVALMILLVAALAWLGWWLQGTARPAMPLGHHNLLATWLVALLPLAAVGWREAGASRSLAIAATVVAVATLVASRSLSGVVALSIAIAMAWAWRSRRRAAWALPLSALVIGLTLLPQLPRLAALRAGSDASTAARLVYLRAGWQGFLERPWLGWGPGSTGWTVAQHLPPSPGLLPADQAVAELHSLPLTLLYELGLPAMLLAVVLLVVFVRRRWTARPRDAGLLAGASSGFAALLVASLAGLPLSVTALALAAMVLVAAALAASADAAKEATAPVSGWPVWLYVMLVASLLRPYDQALWLYNRAAFTDDPATRLVALERAYELDGAMPLYGFRLARELNDPRRASLLASESAERAGGVAALWLSAGQLASENDPAAAKRAWQQACDLAPLGAVAPFRLALADPYDPWAVERTARALLASPELRAARQWQDHEALVGRAVDQLSGENGIEQGWRWALYESWLRLLEQAPNTDEVVPRLVLGMDGEGAESVSLHVFRRRPWPAELASIELDPNRLEEARQVAASGLTSTATELFAEDCRLGSVD